MPKKFIQTGSAAGKGEYYKDPLKHGQQFEKEQKTSASKGSKFFRNFHRTFQRNVMTTYDDADFLTIYELYLTNINDGALKESAFDALFNVGWEIGAKTGNIKDIDSTQESNTQDWFRYWLQMAWNIAAQMMRRPLTAGMTESSTGDNDRSHAYNWTQADWDAFLSSLEKLDCPDFIYRFMKPFLFIIRVTEAYERAGISVPPSYFIPIFDYSSNQLTEMQAIRELAKGVSANAMVHCRKFGIPFSKFSADKLKSKEVSREGIFKDQDILAFFNIAFYTYTNSDPANVRVDHAAILSGANLTTDYSNIVHIFDQTQEQSILRAMMPIFGSTHDGTNNPYANIISVVPTDGATEYTVSFMKVKNLGTSWTVAQIDNIHHILKWFVAYYYESALYGPAYTGSKVTLSTKFITYTAHPAFDENRSVVLDTGHCLGTEHLDSCLQAFKFMIYGS